VRGRADEPRDDSRWRSRRCAALALRLVVLLAPVSVCVGASFVVTRLVPAPAGLLARLSWLSGVVLICGLLAWPARRQLRRLLPLATLLELSILFPGAAPSRWKVAREAGSIKHLEFLATGPASAEPVKAATTILALVASLARHDRVTRGHSERVRVFTDMVGEEIGLPRADRDRLRWAALIHDIGKLEVPAKLLRKPGKPSASEWETLRLHPATGARLAAPMADWLGEYSKVILEHHERFDGTGYPTGLRADEITLGGRIVALADAFETMTAARPYKRALSRPDALREVVRCSGTHFDPVVVRALLAVSTPQLRKALGPVSWVGQLPVVGTAPVGGLPSVAAAVARGAGAVMVSGAAGAVVAGSVGPISALAATSADTSSRMGTSQQANGANNLTAVTARTTHTGAPSLTAPTSTVTTARVAAPSGAGVAAPSGAGVAAPSGAGVAAPGTATAAEPVPTGTVASPSPSAAGSGGGAQATTRPGSAAPLAPLASAVAGVTSTVGAAVT
jgi:hypothetical protein